MLMKNLKHKNWYLKHKNIVTKYLLNIYIYPIKILNNLVSLFIARKSKSQQKIKIYSKTKRCNFFDIFIKAMHIFFSVWLA